MWPTKFTILVQFLRIHNAHPYYNPHVFNCGYASIDINHDINHIKCFNVDIIEEVNKVSNQLLLLTSPLLFAYETHGRYKMVSKSKSRL